MTSLRYVRLSFSSVRTVISLIHSSSFERLMNATVMCMRGVHNEPIFTRIVKEPLLLGLWFCSRTKILDMETLEFAGRVWTHRAGK